jgi:hypothetical protein
MFSQAVAHRQTHLGICCSIERAYWRTRTTQRINPVHHEGGLAARLLRTRWVPRFKSQIRENADALVSTRRGAPGTLHEVDDVVHHLVNTIRCGEDHRVNSESRIQPSAVEHDRKPDSVDCKPDSLTARDPWTCSAAQQLGLRSPGTPSSARSLTRRRGRSPARAASTAGATATATTSSSTAASLASPGLSRHDDPVVGVHHPELLARPDQALVQLAVVAERPRVQQQVFH